MSEAEVWPPRSPMKALLSSPSGRKKYRDYRESGVKTISPSKLLGSPSLLEKLRAARADRDYEILETSSVHDDEEEDEETLQLKLQAIEAKLKLKKLQQQKARATENVRPGSMESAVTSASSRLEVASSPNKRVAPTLQRSPNRILLGIDKGLHASDVSLKRAKTINASPTKKQRPNDAPEFVRRPSIFTQCRPSTASTAPAKTFSERMSEMRDREADREKKTSAVLSSRSSRFKINKAEIESYSIAAEPANTDPSKQVYGTNDGQENERSVTKSIKHSRSMPSLRSTSPVKAAPSNSALDTDDKKGDPSLYEGFSSTHLTSRVLPHSFLKRTLPTDQFTIYKVPDLLKNITSPEYEIPDGVGNYVVFGIIAQMSNPRNHKAKSTDTHSTGSKDWEKKWDDGANNNQKFLVMTLTDLRWTVDLFLFDRAVPRYHRLTPGTLIAVLNPGIMPPKKGREDTGAFSLTLNDGEDQILEIGKAKYLGYCNAKKKDGSECGQWINASKTSICEFHLNAQVNRTRGARAGVNSMYGWHSDRPKDKEKKATSRGFDWESQSFYYAVGGTATKKGQEQRWSFAPTSNPNLSTAKLIDRAGNLDDPFLAEGQMLERDKSDRLRKRMESLAREHEIAKKLSKFGGSAGGQYMLSRTAEEGSREKQTGLKHATSSNAPDGSVVTKEDILAQRVGEKRKSRTADSVRLGPVRKKTRFLTDQGIKEAGRESLGPSSGPPHLPPSGRQLKQDDDTDDDDDLDII